MVNRMRFITLKVLKDHDFIPFLVGTKWAYTGVQLLFWQIVLTERIMKMEEGS